MTENNENIEQSFQLKNIYIRTPEGAIKGPFPLAATTKAGNVVYTNAELQDSESVEAALNYLFQESTSKKNLFTDLITTDIDKLQRDVQDQSSTLETLNQTVNENKDAQDWRLETHDTAINTLNETTETLDTRLQKLEAAVDEEDRDKLDALTLVDDNLQLAKSNSNIATENYVNTKIANVTDAVVTEAIPLVKEAVSEELLGEGIITEEYLQNNYLSISNAETTYSTIETVENLTNRVETIENKEVDLSNYYTKTEIDARINTVLPTPDSTGADNGKILMVSGSEWIINSLDIYDGEVYE